MPYLAHSPVNVRKVSLLPIYKTCTWSFHRNPFVNLVPANKISFRLPLEKVIMSITVRGNTVTNITR